MHLTYISRQIKEKPIAEKEMKLLRGGLKIIPLPRQVDSRWCKIKTRCNDDANIDFEGIQTESKVPKFIIFEADFVLETDAIKFNGIYKPGFHVIHKIWVVICCSIRSKYFNHIPSNLKP